MQPFPYIIINNIALLNNHILIQLNEINHASNVRFVQILNRMYILVTYVEIFLVTNVANKLANFRRRQLVKPNTNKLVLKRQLDFADIIAN